MRALTAGVPLLPGLCLDDLISPSAPREAGRVIIHDDNTHFPTRMPPPSNCSLSGARESSSLPHIPVALEQPALLCWSSYGWGGSPSPQPKIRMDGSAERGRRSGGHSGHPQRSSYNGEGTGLAQGSRWGFTFICSTWVLAQPLSPSKKQDSMTREPFLPLRTDIPIRGGGVERNQDKLVWRRGNWRTDDLRSW